MINLARELHLSQRHIGIETHSESLREERAQELLANVGRTLLALHVAECQRVMNEERVSCCGVVELQHLIYILKQQQQRKWETLIPVIENVFWDEPTLKTGLFHYRRGREPMRS